jgi:hypothetical protein
VASVAEEIQKAGQDPGTQGVILDLRSTRATGKTMEFEVLKALAEKVSAPLGIIPDRDVEEVLAAFPSEKLAKIVLSEVEGSSCKVPPEKLLLIKETSR